jgi:hypothetical protein
MPEKRGVDTGMNLTVSNSNSIVSAYLQCNFNGPFALFLLQQTVSAVRVKKIEL